MIRRCFKELNPGTTYLHNWHIDLIAGKLMDCMHGKIRRLIINIPPRYLKSICASVALPAFWLGHDPSARIICASYGQDLADKHAMDCRTIMQTPWYQAVFPGTRFPQRQTISELITDKHGGRLSTSIAGTLTGFGGKVLIIDDPSKPDEALNETFRKKVKLWFNGTGYTRLDDKETGCMIIIMQRLHEDDLVGHVLTQGSWEVVSLPAIAVEDEIHSINLPSCSYVQCRSIGEALHPARESLAGLDQIKRNLGSYNFAGQYQQSPAPQDGGMINANWFKTCDQLPDSFDRVVQSWDTASKESQFSDYSVCTTWGVKGKNIFLINVFRKRLLFPELKREVVYQQRLFNADIVLVEDKSSGTALIQELLHEGVRQITKFTPEGDKVTRMHTQTATIENGFVFLPREAHWKEDYLHEMVMFPNGRHDDQVDSTSQALTYINRPRPGAGWAAFFKEHNEKYDHAN